MGKQPDIMNERMECLLSFAKEGNVDSAKEMLDWVRGYISDDLPLPPFLKQYMVDAIGSIVDKNMAADSAFLLQKKRGNQLTNAQFEKETKVTQYIIERMEEGETLQNVCNNIEVDEIFPIKADQAQKIYKKPQKL